MNNILVVHDDEWVRVKIANLLSATTGNYNVVMTSNKNDAIRELRHHIYDVIVTDVSLIQPCGYDKEGLEVLRAAKQIRPTPRVIVVTAFGGMDVGVEAMQLGAFDYIEECWPGVSALDLITKKVQLAIACSSVKSRFIFRGRSE